jgi:ATP-dependent DNA ligase
MRSAPDHSTVIEAIAAGVIASVNGSGSRACPCPLAANRGSTRASVAAAISAAISAAVAAAVAAGCEGIVSKRADSRYRATRAWLKIKPAEVRARQAEQVRAAHAKMR